MVELATQLIERQVGRYDPADLEDRYETRLRAMIDATLKGQGVDLAVDEPDVRSNVIDLMGAEEEPRSGVGKADGSGTDASGGRCQKADDAGCSAGV